LILFRQRLILFRQRLILFRQRLILFRQRLILFRQRLILFRQRLILFRQRLILRHSIFKPAGDIFSLVYLISRKNLADLKIFSELCNEVAHIYDNSA